VLNQLRVPALGAHAPDGRSSNADHGANDEMAIQHCTFDVAGERQQQSAVEPWAPSTPAVLSSCGSQAKHRCDALRLRDGLGNCICVAPATVQPVFSKRVHAHGTTFLIAASAR
jgi:hypothetical protein